MTILQWTKHTKREAIIHILLEEEEGNPNFPQKKSPQAEWKKETYINFQ